MNKFMKWVEEGFLEEAGVILKLAWKDADLLQKEGRGRSKEKGEERQRHRPMSEHSTVRQWAEKQGSGQEQAWTQKGRLFTHSAKHLSCCISVSWRDTGVLEQFLSGCGLLPRGGHWASFILAPQGPAQGPAPANLHKSLNKEILKSLGFMLEKTEHHRRVSNREGHDQGLV